MDRTPLFNQCVAIVQQELSSATPSHDTPPFLVHDTFNKECRQLYVHIISVNAFLSEIRIPYLSETEQLSIDDKNKVDQDIQIKVQAVVEKLKILEKYETARQATIKPKSTWFGDYFGDEDEEIKSVYFTQIKNHRNLVLRFLATCINYTSHYLQDLQRQRTSRERQVDLLNFQNLDDHVIYDQVDSHTDDNPMKLNDQQLQELQVENSHLLELKANQLEQVESLHTSMVDIINLQSEISYHIQLQLDQIMSLIDTQHEVTADMGKGNKQLRGATARNKRAANMLVYGCFILGVLLLMMDYIR